MRRMRRARPGGSVRRPLVVVNLPVDRRTVFEKKTSVDGVHCCRDLRKGTPDQQRAFIRTGEDVLRLTQLNASPCERAKRAARVRVRACERTSAMIITYPSTPAPDVC